MAEGSATSIGLKEMREAVDRLPATVTASLRAVAWRSSRNIYAKAKALLVAQQKTPSRKLANAMEIIEDAEKKRFEVISHPPGDQPANLPIWNEHGTRFMRARPYMRPALDSEQATYHSEMQQASQRAAEEALK
jgi:hypothetical protein